MNNSALMDNLRQLFAECDTDNNGSLGRAEFSELCTKIGLNRDAANETFDRLDIDKNDRITFDEFAAGFNQYANKQPPSTPSPAPSTGAGAARNSSPAAGQSLSPAPPDSPRSVNSRSPISSTRSPVAARRQRLATVAPVAAASPAVASAGARKSSPMGLVSLGSAGSSGTNLASGSRSSGGTGVGAASSSGELFTSSDINYATLDDAAAATGNSRANPMVVYSSDMIEDYDQAGGSGQFGSLLSSSGSFSGARNMQDLLESVQKLQSENQVLSQIFFKDKREREEYISQLGEEFDMQVREVEERANKRAREELENEKRRLREMMQAERETLQHHYQTIEKMSKLIKSPNSNVNKLGTEDAESIDKVRSKLEDTYLENRKLKRSLLDTKTDVAMIWKEMEKLKQQYESKLSNAYERNNETKNECDHIKQQLNLMKDSNKKLQDASDVITTYITDKVEPVIKVASGEDMDPHLLGPGGSGAGSLRLRNAASPATSRRGSILSEYLLSNGADPDSDSLLDAHLGGNGGNSSAADVESLDSSGGGRRSKSKISAAPPTHDRLSPANGDDSVNEMSRQSEKTNQLSNKTTGEPPVDTYKSTTTNTTTATAINSNTTKENAQKIEANESAPVKAANLNANITTKSTNSISQNQVGSQNLKQQQKQQNQPRAKVENDAKASETAATASSTAKSSFKNISRHFFIGSRTQSEPQIAENLVDESKKNGGPGAIKSISVDKSNEPVVEPADGPSKATFNIILVGDSFVGKSSFAARFVEGSFVQGLISNCSIDFKTKTFKVDGVNYTVNLWDTAGQERFRSITASYFRKADGIILMYDVTDKRSYLNVRNWMSTISDTAAENVAVLLIGNKIDLRQKENRDKCVPTDEGFRLAKEYDIVFLETSVKTGTNLVPSLGKLIKLIAKNNAPEEEDTDRIRLNDKSKMFKCMPKNC